MLAVTIPDLKPNSQDTSAFYLENIYQLFAGQNASNGSIPSTLAKPPPFSPPRYVVWVNSLWLLALLVNLSGALLMMLTKSFVLRYISATQREEYSPEMRARVRATLSNAERTFNFRDSNSLPFCLHLSLFLFMVGLLIYIFNINHSIFAALVWWIAITTLVYAAYTSNAFFGRSLLYTPFSPLVLRLYLGFAYAASQLCSRIKPLHRLSYLAMYNYDDLSNHGSGRGFFEDKRKRLEKAAAKPSSDTDAEVLVHTLLVLDEDNALKSFFDAIPGFCVSKLVKKPLNFRVTTKLQHSLDEFLDRTFSSQLVTELARNDRLVICLNAAYSALGPSAVSKILGNFFNGRRDKALKSVELGHSLIRWDHSSDELIYPNVRRIVARIISRTRDRNDRWAMLVKEVFGLPDDVIRNHLAYGDSVFLAILLHVARDALDTGRLAQGFLKSLSQFDIRNTIAGLHHEFCTLWNEVVEKARNAANQETRITAAQILTEIHDLFAALHQGSDSGPTRPHVVSSGHDDVQGRAFPLCNIASHYPTADNPATTFLTVPPPTRFGDPLNSPSHPTLPSQFPLTASRDSATKNATAGNADISVTSGIADPVRGSNSGGSSALQQAEEAGPMPHPLVLGSLPTPILTPALHSANSVVLTPPIDSALTQTDHDRPSLGAPSSISTTIPLSVIPQVATISDQSPDIRDGTTGAQYDNQDTHPRILSVDHRQSPPGGATGL